MSKKDDPPPEFDPDVTITGPLTPVDPEKAVSAKMRAALEAMDPEDTVKPLPREPDPEATFSGPLSAFDPDATVGGSGSIRRRANPFAPKALPEALQANLAALGGLNPLIAFANPILSAVPQIAAARNHPDPALLKETLQDLIEAFEAGARKIGVQAEVLEGAVYALCCMADDAAASTPWGTGWIASGLLQELRGENNGGEGFFDLIEAVKPKPEENAELLELLFICLALGFQGRYRGKPGGVAEVNRIRADLHAVIALRRRRPEDGLSEKWRGSPVAAAPRIALPRPAPAAKSVLPWRTIGITAGAAALALLVLFAGYRAMMKPAEESVPPVAPVASAPPPAPVEAQPTSPDKTLATLAKGGLVALSEKGGFTTVSIRNDHQYPLGIIEPLAGTQAVLEQIAGALDSVPGKIVVRGHADNVPVKPGVFASNTELSAARAKAAAAVIAAKLREPQRVTSEGAGEANPVAPNDTDENRARNRRVEIVLGQKP